MQSAKRKSPERADISALSGNFQKTLTDNADFIKLRGISASHASHPTAFGKGQRSNYEDC